MKKNNLTKHFTCYIIVCVIILILPILFYVCAFHQNEWGSPTDWGAFGSFYGGVLTPVITVIVIIVTLLTLKAKAKDTLHKERKDVQEKLFDYSLLMNEVVSDYLAENSLFFFDTAKNKEKNYTKVAQENDAFDKINDKVQRNMRFFCGILLAKVSKARYYIEYFSDKKITIFEGFDYENSNCHKLKCELIKAERALKKGLSGDFSEVDINLMNKVNELFLKFLTEINEYVSKNQFK